jgi:hypothetical protein
MMLKRKESLIKYDHDHTKRQCLGYTFTPMDDEEDNEEYNDEDDKEDNEGLEWLENNFARINVEESEGVKSNFAYINTKNNFQDFFGDIYTALQKEEIKKVHEWINELSLDVLFSYIDEHLMWLIENPEETIEFTKLTEVHDFVYEQYILRTKLEQTQL